MVRQLTTETYTQSSNDVDLTPYFSSFPYELSPFQKFAIEAIVTGNHSLSCVPTGSGKTLPALFAIDFFSSQIPKKKVIYTSPIKALSNQKYYEFTQKFPHLSIGLLTGDIKINPEADVLIMTAEILQNTLYKKTQVGSIADGVESDRGIVNPLLMFDVDFDTELACVIQDEVHMINDVDRGHVWENTILMLPKHIQMVMLSATLDDPAKFARWIETRGEEVVAVDNVDKQVYLATSTYRPVPLTHYSFITATSGLFKAVRDKSEQERLRRQLNTLHVIQDAGGKFDESKYHELRKTLGLIAENKLFIKRAFVLNEVCKYMFEHNMLPAVCFILSKRQIAEAAREVNVPLLEDDSKVAYTVHRECEQLLRAKLPNFQEYLALPEYVDMVKLLERGIAVHHSGVLPVIREIVEMMFERGHIKLLFATETFSVGLNMPIKTVLFTDVKKFDGSTRRMLLPHEFVQASGRAGRRGIDTVGNVIHLTNLFRNIELTDYRVMMQGKAQSLVSKFRISYNLVLNLFASSVRAVDVLPSESGSSSGETRCAEFCKKSMIQHEISGQIRAVDAKISHEKSELDRLVRATSSLRTPEDAIAQFTYLQGVVATAKNKARKQADRDIKNLEDVHKYINADMKTFRILREKHDIIASLEQERECASEYLNHHTRILMDKFYEAGFMVHSKDTDDSDACSISTTMTRKGVYATNLREVPCMVFAEVAVSKSFIALTSCEFVALASCFAGVRVQEEHRRQRPPNNLPTALTEVIRIAEGAAHHYLDFENSHKISTGTDYELSYDIIDYVIAWCDADTQETCKVILQDMESNDGGISTGEFVKALIKITNIASELARTCEFIGDILTAEMLSKVPAMVLKYIATNQSLYV